jgi:hypothetical protein
MRNGDGWLRTVYNVGRPTSGLHFGLRSSNVSVLATLLLS